MRSGGEETKTTASALKNAREKVNRRMPRIRHFGALLVQINQNQNCTMEELGGDGLGLDHSVLKEHGEQTEINEIAESSVDEGNPDEDMNQEGTEGTEGEGVHGTQCFKNLIDKPVAEEIKLFEWCPTMDLLAWITADDQLIVQRLSWQRLFSIRTHDQPTTALTWRPDGALSLLLPCSAPCRSFYSSSSARSSHHRQDHRGGPPRRQDIVGRCGERHLVLLLPVPLCVSHLPSLGTGDGRRRTGRRSPAACAHPLLG